MKWNTKLYDEAQAFVSEYGKGLISHIPQRNNLRILDLGCGTGNLTKEIQQKLNCNILGVDCSEEMIEKAREKYPEIDFIVCDACNLPFKNEFDVVFSNAVFHWIYDQKALHKSIYKSMKPNGILICEFGGYKNIYNISNSFNKAITNIGVIYTNPFYFPKVEEHLKVLNESGFVADKIYDYDRPTELPNGELGLRQWVIQFFSSYFEGLSDGEKESILKFIEDELKDKMFDGEKWTADYKRLRVIAHSM